MKEIKDLTRALTNFRDDRNWEQFHNSKDLALAISIEASELLELFLWKGNEDVDKQKLKEELADIFSFSILLANKHKLNIKDIIMAKIKQNSKKYPVNKAKGKSTKYTDLL